MNLGNYKIATKILAVIILLSATSIAITVKGVISLRNIDHIAHEVGKLSREITLAERMTQNVISLSRAEYRIATNPSTSNIRQTEATIEEEKAEFKQLAQEVYTLAQDDEKVLLQKVNQKFDEYERALENTVNMAKRIAGAFVTDEDRRNLLDNIIANRNIASEFKLLSREFADHITEKSSKAQDRADETYQTASMLMIAGAVFGILAGLIIGTIISQKGIVNPMRKIVACLSELANGNLNIDVYGTDRKDEVGEIAETTLVFKQNMLRNKEMEEEQRKEQIAKEQRQNKIDAATKDFELAMTDVVQLVTSASAELQNSAQSLSALAEETSVQSANVAAASEQASANVQTVASATEEMSSCISEISQQVTRSSNVANKAVEDAREAVDSVAKLVEAAQRIGDVTDIISSIAEQTNLLALNATIEAARAGEAGKGFAVVATEVKSLANESAKATEEISSQIADIQRISSDSAHAIETICSIIEEINTISNTIAAAVVEQSAATQEISRNATQAHTGTEDVTKNITHVSSAAGDTGNTAHQVLAASDELSRQSIILKEQYEKYIQTVKSA